jgi:hypothetical protein
VAVVLAVVTSLWDILEQVVCRKWSWVESNFAILDAAPCRSVARVRRCRQ